MIEDTKYQELVDWLKNDGWGILEGIHMDLTLYNDEQVTKDDDFYHFSRISMSTTERVEALEYCIPSILNFIDILDKKLRLLK